ncbi:MAG: flagellar export chaperone FliS [Spirochaetales bacterium]|nr:flagellar export chaperone FliS [Spirochaetales bacterium]
MGTFNRLNAYKETHIKTASGGKLILMIYDEAVRQLDIALEALENGKYKMDSVSNSIIKTQDLITELIVSLDFEKGGEIASSLFSLYMFFNQQLMEANIKKDIELLKKVRVYLTDLRGAWTEVVAKAGAENVQDERSGGINIAG